MFLTVEPGRGGRGHLSLGTKVLTVESGRDGEGSFVSRNNDSNCQTTILTVEPGRGGEWSFVSRNKDSNCKRQMTPLSTPRVIVPRYK